MALPRFSRAGVITATATDPRAAAELFASVAADAQQPLRWLLRKKIKRRCREMKMGAQIRTGKRLPDTGKRFRDRIWAYAQGTQLLALSEFPISIGKSFSGADLYPHFHFQITVEPPRLIFFLSGRL